ncbi:MAG: endolytic transglycosylase MltG [Candidatus Paceibacterota bacterium]
MYSFKPLVIRITIYSIVVLFLGYFSYITFTIPRNFPIGKNFIVEEGESLRSVSARLEKEGYIDYSLWFRAGVSFLGGDKNIQLGGYMFDRPRTLGYVVRKFVSGNPDTPLISVTIPEGSTTHEIAVLVHGVLPNIDISVFEYEVLKINQMVNFFLQLTSYCHQ